MNKNFKTANRIMVLLNDHFGQKVSPFLFSGELKWNFK